MTHSFSIIRRAAIIRAAALMASVLLEPTLHAQGTSGTTYSTITITGTASANTLDVTGSNVLFGSWSNDGNTEGVYFNYNDGTSGANASFSTYLMRPISSWNLYRMNSALTTASPVLTLTASNQLILTGTQSSPGSIIIDPTAGNITVNGRQVVTGSSGVASLAIGTSFSTTGNSSVQTTLFGSAPGFLFVDSGTSSGSIANDMTYHRFTFYNNISLMGLYLFNDGSIGLGSNFSSAGYNPIAVDASSNVSFEAGQVVLDTAGDASFAGNVGIGTTAPQATLDVQGSGNFTGPVYLQPQGDISMGNFTSGTPPSGGGGGDDAMSFGGARGFSDGATTSGTSGN